MRPAWALAVTVLALGLTGCSGGDGQADRVQTARSSPSPAAVAPSSTAPPEYVENQTCRTGMAPLVAIMLANDQHSLAYGTFDNRVNQLDRKMDAAVAACSAKVTNPARKVVYRFTLARAQWDTCGQHDDECTTKVADNIRAGLDLARKVDYQLDLTA